MFAFWGAGEFQHALREFKVNYEPGNRFIPSALQPLRTLLISPLEIPIRLILIIS